MTKRSKILVFIQFSCFIYFILIGNLFAENILLLIQLLGFGVAIWGIYTMKVGNFNIQPEVKFNAEFITNGPYKYIRNPMYLGVLLFFSLSVASNYSFISLVVYIMLFVVIILKIISEEKYLLEKFGNKYTTYKTQTYRLIPFIY